MRVHRVAADVEKFQWVMPVDSSLWATELLRFDGSSKAAGWSPLEVRVIDPTLTAGDFLNFGPGAIACTLSTAAKLQDVLKTSGELLPLSLDGDTLLLLNVTSCPDCLADPGTEWVHVKGQRVRIHRYEFHGDRICGSSLFKIPETRLGQILTVEGRVNPHDEFKPRVEELGLTGLRFELLWEGS